MSGAQQSGKTTLVDSVVSGLMSSADASVSTNAATNNFVAYSYCKEGGEERAPYQIFSEIMGGSFQGPDSALRSVVLGTVPAWVQAVPVIGPVLDATKQSFNVARSILLGQAADSFEGIEKAVMDSRVSAVLNYLKSYEKAIFIVREAQWIDKFSCDAIEQILKRGPEKRGPETEIYFVLEYTSGVAALSSRLRELRRNLLQHGGSVPVVLENFDIATVTKYLVDRGVANPDPAFSQWLHRITKGNPGFVARYVDLLLSTDLLKIENDVIQTSGMVKSVGGTLIPQGSLSRISIPQEIENVFERQLEELDPESVDTLRTAAVQGDRFLSAILAKQLEIPEKKVVKTLSEISNKYGLIHSLSSKEINQSRSGIFAFEAHALQQLLYGELVDRLRVLYHQEVAQALIEFYAEDEITSVGTYMEVASHLRSAHQNMESLKYSVLAGWAALAVGAKQEAELASRRAYRDIQQLYKQGMAPGSVDGDLVGTSCELYILSRWGELRGSHSDDEINALDFIREAIKSTSEIENLPMLARLWHLKGRLEIARTSVQDSLVSLKRAVDLASSGEDELTKFIVTSEYGHQLVKESIDQGISVMRSAKAAYEVSKNTGGNNQAIGINTLKQMAEIRFEVFIGVAEFDSGNYEEALKSLKPALEKVRECGMDEQIGSTGNYIAQVYISVGYFEECEKHLLNILAETEHLAPNSWLNANRVLLGKLYLEWNDTESAADNIEQGWKETLRTWTVDVGTLCANYRAEYFLISATGKSSINEVRAMLESNISIAKEAGLHRSEAQSWSLLSILERKLGGEADSLSASSRAVKILKERGPMPALRTEEIYYNHCEAMAACGEHSAAAEYAAAAHSEMLRKAEKMPFEMRRCFLHNVNLNEKILASYALYSSSAV